MYLTIISEADSIIKFNSLFIDISDYLKLPPVKLHCSMLAEDAIKAAITDYKKKVTEKE